MAIGATVWARKTIESEIFYYKPAMWFKIWFYLVSRVNWEDGKLFKKGEALITYKEIMAATRASKAQVEKCMKYLKKEDMVASRRTTRGEVRFILKYAQYQDWSYYKEELKKTKEKTCGRLGEGTDSRNKNTRKNNNKKLYKKENSHSPDGSLGEKDFLNVQPMCNQSTTNGLPVVEDTKAKKRKSSAKKKKDLEDFDKFWAVYPRKTAKGGARKAFAKALKKTTTDIMISAVEKQKYQEQWTKDDGTYIPHPSTWLNQECWEDEVGGGYSQKESDRDIDWSKIELPIINP